RPVKSYRTWPRPVAGSIRPVAFTSVSTGSVERFSRRILSSRSNALVVRRRCAASWGDPEAALALGFGGPPEPAGEAPGPDVGDGAIADGGLAFGLADGVGVGVEAQPVMATPSRMAG